MHVGTVGSKHGQMGIEEAELIGTGGDVDHVHQILHALGNLHAVLQSVAAVKQLGAAHTELDGKAGADGVADAGQHLPRKTQPVLKAAAVLIGTMVEGGRQELV